MKRQAGLLGLLLTCALTASASEPWTLERALDYALAHNPDARLAEQRMAAAQAGLEPANSAFWPRLQFQSSYTRTDNPMMVFGSILNQRAYNPSLNFNDPRAKSNASCASRSILKRNKRGSISRPPTNA